MSQSTIERRRPALRVLSVVGRIAAVVVAGLVVLAVAPHVLFTSALFPEGLVLYGQRVPVDGILAAVAMAISAYALYGRDPGEER